MTTNVRQVGGARVWTIFRVNHGCPVQMAALYESPIRFIVNN